MTTTEWTLPGYHYTPYTDITRETHRKCPALYSLDLFLFLSVQPDVRRATILDVALRQRNPSRPNLSISDGDRDTDTHT